MHNLSTLNYLAHLHLGPFQKRSDGWVTKRFGSKTSFIVKLNLQTLIGVVKCSETALVLSTTPCDLEDVNKKNEKVVHVHVPWLELKSDLPLQGQDRKSCQLIAFYQLNLGIVLKGCGPRT